MHPPADSAEASQDDLIDRLVGSAVVARRRRRHPALVRTLQRCHRIVFSDALWLGPTGPSVAERLALVAQICRRLGRGELASHWQDSLAKPGGRSRGALLANVCGASRAAEEAMTDAVERALSGTRPAGFSWSDPLRAAGLADADIVLLAQLLGLVRCQLALADGLAATPDDAEPDDLGPEDAMREATIPIDGPAMEGGETDGEDASAWADGTPLQVLLAPQPEIAAAFDAAWAAAFDPAIEAGGIERLTRQSLRVWRRQLRRLLADEAER